eukprot:2656148-Alexandrium_andersonii.AAC.1
MPQQRAVLAPPRCSLKCTADHPLPTPRRLDALALLAPASAFPMPSVSMPVSTPPPLFSAMALAVKSGAPFGPPTSDEAAMLPRRAAL